jgi:hypothetical protein
VAQRDQHGRFLPGTSGHPGGSPGAGLDVKRLACAHSTEAFNKLLELMRGDDAELSLRAAMAVLDRALGKPAQAITGPDDGPIRHEHGMSPAAERIAEEIAASLSGEGDDGAEAGRPTDREAVLAEQVAAARRH